MKEITEFGIFWGTIRYLEKKHIRIGAIDLTQRREGWKCPKCTFVSSEKSQVLSHMSQSHKDTQINSRETPRKVTIQCLYTDIPPERSYLKNILQASQNIEKGKKNKNMNDEMSKDRTGGKRNSTNETSPNRKKNTTNSNNVSNGSNCQQPNREEYTNNTTNIEGNNHVNNAISNINRDANDSNINDKNTNINSERHDRNNKDNSPKNSMETNTVGNSRDSSIENDESVSLSNTEESENTDDYQDSSSTDWNYSSDNEQGIVQDKTYEISESEFKNALDWQKDLQDDDLYLPILTSTQRKKIQEPVKNYLQYEALPLVQKFTLAMIPDKTDEQRWNAIDGVITKIENDLVNIVRSTLRIRKKKRNNTQDNETEFQIKQLANAKTHASTIARLLSKVNDIQNQNNNEIDEDTEIDHEQRNRNEISRLIDQIAYHVQGINKEACKELFGKEEAGIAEIRSFVDSPKEHKEEKILWLTSQEETLEGEIEKIRREKAKKRSSQCQALYSDNPRKAMQWFVLNDGTPACTINPQEVEDVMRARWSADTSYRPPENEETIWTPRHPLTSKMAGEIKKDLTDPKIFEDVIKTRNKTSANGPDGVSYALFQMNTEAASKIIALISKAMMKYEDFPTLWKRSRSILIYKKGDPNIINNWRPLTISSSAYRIGSLPFPVF